MHGLSAMWRGRAAVGAPSTLNGAALARAAQQLQLLISFFVVLALFLCFLIQGAVCRLLGDSTGRRHRKIQINSPPSSGRSAVPGKVYKF